MIREVYAGGFTIPGGSNGKESACDAGGPIQSLGWEGPLEKGMATHFCIPAWRISWTEKPASFR